MNQQFNPQEFNDLMRKKLEENLFPAEQLSTKWKQFAIRALEFGSFTAMGINPEDYRKMPNWEGGLSLQHFATLSNNLQSRTPRELELDLEQYADLMEEADQHVKVWHELTAPLQEQVNQEMAEVMKARVLVSQQVKDGKPNPLRAEA